MTRHQPPGDQPLTSLALALAGAGHLIGGVAAAQWTAPTPCPEWDVRQLVNHLVAGNLAVAALVGDQAPPDRSADQLGDDPGSAYRASAAALQAAFAQPGALERTFGSPYGPAPGSMLVHLRITELLVHGWDLARATGQPPGLPDALAQNERALSRAQLGSAPRDAMPIAEPQAAPAGAAAIDRLAAFFGRQVSS
jgi:uncharacterized protein (TIGR03086 family)